MKIGVTGQKIYRAKRVIDETGGDNAMETGDGLKVDNPENLDGFILAGASNALKKKNRCGPARPGTGIPWKRKRLLKRIQRRNSRSPNN